MCVNFDKQIQELIERAVFRILGGECKRVDVAPDVKVYLCKNVVRIDLKAYQESGACE